MRKINCSENVGGFLLSLLLNMVFNLEWTVPAWILLAMHFILGWHIKWFFIALAAWLAVILIKMLLLRSLNRIGNERDPIKENKNPYSVGNKQNNKE